MGSFGYKWKAEYTMPLYEYHCPDNGQVVEVRHRMAEKLETWGEVCEVAGRERGATPGGATVERILSAPVPTPSGGANAGFQGCGTGCACARDA